MTDHSSPVTELVRRLRQHDGHLGNLVDEAADFIESGLAQTPAPPRTPTEEMLIAARDWSLQKFGNAIGNDAAIGCWQVMLDAAQVTSTHSTLNAEPANHRRSVPVTVGDDRDRMEARPAKASSPEAGSPPFSHTPRTDDDWMQQEWEEMTRGAEIDCAVSQTDQPQPFNGTLEITDAEFEAFERACFGDPVSSPDKPHPLPRCDCGYPRDVCRYPNCASGDEIAPVSYPHRGEK